jgi:O-antigen ligase
MPKSWRTISGGLAEAASFVLLPAAAFSPLAGGVAFWILAIIGLLPSDPQVRAQPGRALRLRWLVLAGALPCMLNLVSVLLYGSDARELSLLTMLLLPLVARGAEHAPDPVRRFVDGGVAACFVAFAAALWSRLMLGEARPGFMMNPLLFGNLAFVVTVIAAWDLSLHPPGWRRRLSAWATAAGIAAFLASGFRGGLLALPLLLGAFLHLGEGAARRAQVRWRSALVTVFVIVGLAAAAAPSVSVVDRLPSAIKEVREYGEGRVDHSSVGSRLAMWAAAGTLLLEHPVFGVGAHRFQQGLQDLRQSGQFPDDVDFYRHAHNSYATVAAEYGTVGLLIMTAALGCALAALWQAETGTRALAVWLLGCWLVFALTNDVLSHQSLIRCCVACIAVFTADTRLRKARPSG